MNDNQLLRYSRHLMLPEIDIAGQERLLAAHALVIGAGGLGSPAVLYLASAGVGHITVVDDDVVELGNLQRQIAHTQQRLGLPKVQSLQQATAAINPDAQLHPIQQHADAALLAQLVPQADVVLDCCDNFATRQAVNRACVHAHKPLVWGAAIGFDGQIGVYHPTHTGSPCYACTFAPDQPTPDVRCATMGVLAPLVGIIGSMQATEAIKLLCGMDSSLHTDMLMLEGRPMRFTAIKLAANPHCGVCGSYRADTTTDNANTPTAAADTTTHTPPAQQTTRG